jgi:hypothetical protein
MKAERPSVRERIDNDPGAYVEENTKHAGVRRSRHDRRHEFSS